MDFLTFVLVSTSKTKVHSFLTQGIRRLMKVTKTGRMSGRKETLFFNYSTDSQRERNLGDGELHSKLSKRLRSTVKGSVQSKDLYLIYYFSQGYHVRTSTLLFQG